MSDAAVASAFADLYAACGLPPPAVRSERSYRSYRRTASVLSGGSEWRSWMSAAAALALFLFALMCAGAGASWIGTLSAGPMLLSENGAAWISAAVSLVSATLGCTAFRMCLSLDSRIQGRTLAAWAGISEIRSTPPAIASAISSALRQGGRPAAHRVPGSSSFMAGCFRLGRRRVLGAWPDPRMIALVGPAKAEPDASLMLRLASAAAGTVDEAILMDGLVLALVPGAAKPLPMRKLPARPGPSRRPAISVPASDPLGELARSAVAAPPDRVEAMLRYLGIDASAAAMGLEPSASDAAGSLYRFSPLLCMVRVEDEVLGPDGKSLVHWITVPPHVLTAREGVAWSFGISVADYAAPTAQS